MDKQNEISPIKYSCHLSAFREGEYFTSTHSLGIVISGEMELYDGVKKKRFKKGDLYSIRKNHLLKFVKYPTVNNQFKSLTIYFDEEFLRDFSREYGYKAESRQISSAYTVLPHDKILTSFMQSLLDYEDILINTGNTKLVRLKQKEVLLLLLNCNATLQNVLFDFSEPYKINLETFMNKNYKFNVSLERFAYLTGRSLSAFKRDFKEIFNEAPNRWLIQKRLEQAHFLIDKKNKKPSEIYLELGFEDLSHFSFAFKKQFGYTPSTLQNESPKK